MSIRTVFVFLLYIAAVNNGFAQQTGASSEKLKLNLEQFPDTQSSPPKEELKLNLEQFDKTNDADKNLQLNLEQFDDNNQSGTNIAADGSKANRKTTGIDKSSYSQHNYRQLFLVGGLVFVVFLYVFTRRKKR